MRVFLLSLISLFLASSASAVAPVVSRAANADAQSLVGTWQVDLRPTPDAPSYFQELVITQAQARSFAGTFYGTPVTQARVNTDWGKVRIAFVTEDGSGPYHHSAVLSGLRLDGLSNSTGRDFLAYWSAVKSDTE